MNGICLTTIDTHPRCLNTVATEAGQVLDTKREIELVLELEALFLLLGENRVSDLKRVLRRHLLIDRRVRDVSVDAQLWPLTGDDVKIGRIAGDHFLQQRAQVYSLRPWGSRRGRRVNER